jgi:hypothetical protein
MVGIVKRSGSFAGVSPMSEGTRSKTIWSNIAAPAGESINKAQGTIPPVSAGRKKRNPKAQLARLREMT